MSIESPDNFNIEENVKNSLQEFLQNFSEENPDVTLLVLEQLFNELCR
jgi:hypothetical protein